MRRPLCIKMDSLNQILRQATSSIEEMYFRLRIDGGDPIYRERVYCYELYHQMRLIWPDDSCYYINGEIDKAAHPILRKLGADRAKPDFLIHCPGYMEGNYAIIEVKHTEAQRQGILKDIETLSLFINKVGYKRAIYLFYGYIEPDIISERVEEALMDVECESATFELWLHNNIQSEAQLIKTFNA